MGVLSRLQLSQWPLPLMFNIQYQRGSLILRFIILIFKSQVVNIQSLSMMSDQIDTEELKSAKVHSTTRDMQTNNHPKTPVKDLQDLQRSDLSSNKRAESDQLPGMSKITDFFGGNKVRAPTSGALHQYSANHQKENTMMNGNSKSLTQQDELAAAHTMALMMRIARTSVINPAAMHVEERQSTDTSSSPPQNQLIGKPAYTASALPRSKLCEEGDQEKQLSEGSRSNLKRRKGSDRLEKSPTISLDRSDKKNNKSREPSVTGGLNGDQASQSITSEGRVKASNRDHCNLCKEGGKLICCDYCPRSFHAKCLGLNLSQLPEGDWYCQTCIPAINKKRQQEEEKSKKNEERDRQLEAKRRLKEEEEKQKAQEIERKREEKKREKERADEEKRLQRERYEEEKKRERDVLAEQKRIKEEELAEQKRQKEAALAEIRAKKEADLAEQRRVREETLAEQKRKREEEAAELKRKREEDLQEAKRKREERLAAEVEARRLRDEAIADAKAKGIPYKQTKIGSSQGSGVEEGLDASAKTGRTEETKKDSVGKAFVQRKAEEKTEAEKAKEARIRELKNQFTVFKRFYPDLVEKNSIRYPIEDQLIKLLPILHGADSFPQKPECKQILTDGQSFERLLYIWEFFNNFSDYFNMTNFKIEELQAALIFSEDGAPLFQSEEPLQDGEELEWEQHISNKTSAEQGFGLINFLHITAMECFFREVRTSMEENASSANAGDGKDSANSSKQDQLLLAVLKYYEKGTGEQQNWPEFIRIILKSRRFTFNPLSEKLRALCDDKLAHCLPETYSSVLTYDEKLELLESLIDGIHGLDDFKTFLNARIEERSSYNKQKMEIYAEIKTLEGQKQEIVKEHQTNNVTSNCEQIMLQIADLQKKLDACNRVDSKRYQQQITDLQNEQNKNQRDLQRVEEQIEKRQAKIERLNEQANKTSIKTQVLGKDADRNEYWFFKEEPAKLFIKKQGTDDQEMSDDTTSGFTWYYYDEEAQFDKLLEACNLKGIRERKLQENLRRLRDRLKLKKSKKVIPIGGMQTTIQSILQKGETKIEINEEEKKEQTEENDDDEQNEQDEHILFQNDNHYVSLINMVWYGRKMPSKRVAPTRRGYYKEAAPKKNPEDIKPTLESLKEGVLSIEGLYTDSGLPLSREWDFKDARDRVRGQIEGAQSIGELGQLLLRLDQGFSHPHMLRYKNVKEDEEEEEEEQEESESDKSEDSNEDESQEEDKKEEEGQADPNVRIIVLKFFKYWPSKDLHSAWREYVFNEVVEDNILALSIAVHILERVNGEFLQRQFETQQKKQRRENNQMMAAPTSKKVAPVQPAQRVTGKQQSYKQYFEQSEEDNSDGSSSMEVIEQRKSSRIQAEPSRKSGRRARKESSSVDEEELSEEEGNSSNEDESMEEVQSVEDNGEDREWDDRCYLCRKAGNLLCCEGCSHVAHLNCVGLKKKPEGDWHCEDCLIKMTQRRTTRGQTTKHTKKGRNSYR